jgi:uncharacterized membrane protein YgdD (TMEM256/DUF423 family)
MNQRTTLIVGAILGGLGVALGAFGAHALKPLLSSLGRVETFELAVRYEFYHAFALLVVGLLQQFYKHTLLKVSAAFFFSGTILFSGSLYLLCFTNNTMFAWVTPIGGLALILGWLFIVTALLQRPNSTN